MTENLKAHDSTKCQRTLKLLMLLILVFHLFCFFPGDMIPLPLVVFNTDFIDNYFGLELYNLISQLIINGMILSIAYIFIKNVKSARYVGLTATLMLTIGTIVLMIYKNIQLNSFEFYSSFPFFTTSITYWLLDIKYNYIQNKS